MDRRELIKILDEVLPPLGVNTQRETDRIKLMDAIDKYTHNRILSNNIMNNLKNKHE